MKIAYFDCPTGLSGNMILGAMLDAGLDRKYLTDQLKALPVTRYSLPGPSSKVWPALTSTLRLSRKSSIVV